MAADWHAGSIAMSLPAITSSTARPGGTDINQTSDFDLGPGQEAFVKIVSLTTTWASGGDKNACERRHFYIVADPDRDRAGPDRAPTDDLGGARPQKFSRLNTSLS